jgi:hypothetical protein
MIVPAWVKPNLTVIYNDFSASLVNGVVQSGAVNFTEQEVVNSVSNLTVQLTETDAVPGTNVVNVHHWTIVEGQIGPGEQFWVDPNNPTQSILGPNGEVFQPLGFNTYDGVNAGFLKYSSSSATYDVIYDASTGLILEADEIFATQELFRNFASISATPTPALNVPVITSNGGGATASISFPENGTAVTTVSATEPGTTLAYSIAGGVDAALFSINGTSGALSFKTAPNFEAPADSDHNNSYIVQVRASDGSHTDDQTITVNVTDVPETTPAQTHWMKSVDIGVHPAGWLPSGNGDYNADGTNDVFWFNAGNTDADVWKIANGNWAGSVDIGTHPPGFTPSGTGDFNHDGTSDVLWVNPATNDTDIWLLSNGHWAGSTTIGSHPAGYQIAGVGDFNHDGTSDVVWFNPSNNDVDVWLVQNGHWAGSVDVGTHPAGYQIAGTGDFNHDGTSDVLWVNPATNDTDIWLLSNGHWAGSTTIGAHPAGYQIAGTGDFNQDGTSDVVWYNPTNNDIDVWLVNNGHWAGSVSVGTHPAGSVVAGVGDFDHNGVSDLMWRDTATNHIETWLLAYN